MYACIINYIIFNTVFQDVVEECSVKNRDL